MLVTCPHCSRALDFTGDPPSFCAYCGERLASTEDSGSVFAASVHSPGLGPGDETVLYVPGPTSPARRLAAPMPDQVAGYRLVRPIGTGGMGTVYEAEDTRSHRRVAIKLLAPEALRSRQAVERFRQEGRLASSLEHPRCVYVLAADEDDEGRPYIVMELMPGATLQGLVEQRGALPIEEALLRTIDVIDGLLQAHRCGVIHRDVKPSNCFIAADGRVKVGDFGLSRALGEEGSAGLTRTGAFVGTPLYASPEQIKGQTLDARTDVYSAAATLYYLLTGTPPFLARDAAATLARIVSESPAPIRSIRRGVPARLEAVIQKGMDRDRERRYPDLESFREALVPFLASSRSIGSLGWRLAAFGVDFVAFPAVFSLILFVSIRAGLYLGGHRDWSQHRGLIEPFRPWLNALEQIALVAYFTLAEGLAGATMGKWLCSLRVTAAGGGPCGIGRAFVRSVVFFSLTGLPFLASRYLLRDGPHRIMGANETLVEIFVLGTSTLVTIGAIGLILASTMRASTGYRGPHEWASGTQVVRNAVRRMRVLHRIRRRVGTSVTTSPLPGGTPEQVGPYDVRAAIAWDSKRRILLGHDAALDRLVWIVFRPTGTVGPTAVRQELSRTARPRWITGGELDGQPWDAYSAPQGCSLAELAGRRGLSWREAAPLLDDLAAELDRSVRDGTVPSAVSTNQVWVQRDGQAMLVDAFTPTQPTTYQDPEPAHRALDLLRRTAILALEGQRPSREALPQRVHAPLPGPAARFLDRLLATPPLITDIGQAHAELRQIRDLPAVVPRARRVLHYLLVGTMAAPIVFFMLTWRSFDQRSQLTSLDALSSFERWALIGMAAFVAVTIVWAAVTRGGLCLKLAGMRLVRDDGRPASPFQCAVRTALAWLPLLLLLFGLPWLGLKWLDAAAFWLAPGYMLLGVVAALAWPARGPLERLAGVWVVPD
jgi:uncharacterized RDD family membrane protein YckC